MPSRKLNNKHNNNNNNNTNNTGKMSYNSFCLKSELVKSQQYNQGLSSTTTRIKREPTSTIDTKINKKRRSSQCSTTTRLRKVLTSEPVSPSKSVVIPVAATMVTTTTPEKPDHQCYVDEEISSSTIGKQELSKYYCLPQPEAAKRLGISLSTLKRRYYEVSGGKRWPYSYYKKSQRKRSVAFIVNQKNKPTKQLDPHTIHVLKKAFMAHLTSPFVH